MGGGFTGSNFVNDTIFLGSLPGTVHLRPKARIFVTQASNSDIFSLSISDEQFEGVAIPVNNPIYNPDLYYRRPMLQPSGTDESTLTAVTGGATWKTFTNEEAFAVDRVLRLASGLGRHGLGHDRRR